MNKEAVINVENISKDFILPHERSGTVKGVFTNMFRKVTAKKENQHALRNISFQVNRGEFFGIVGRNGSGKSTLLKILAGIYQPTEGKISTTGKLVPFIELGVGFNAELTGRDNVYLNGAMLGFSKKEVSEMYDDIVGFAEIERFMDQKLKNYSSGMQVRLAFSMAIRSEADILLLDEVLAVGDSDFQKKCYRYFKSLKKLDKTVVFVSHDMNAVQEYCDRAILIEKSKIISRGTSHDVAMDYTRMFLEQNNNDNTKRLKNRWGSKEVEYSNISLKTDNIKEKDNVVFTTVAKVNKDTDEAIFGFKIRAEDDTQLAGSNTKIKKQDLFNLKKGDEITISWTIPNIFNTGMYLIDLAIQSAGYEDTYDWWDGSTKFQVFKDENNSYPIHPPITAHVVKK